MSKTESLVRNYPFSLSVSFTGILANFELAFNQPTHAHFVGLAFGIVLFSYRRITGLTYAPKLLGHDHHYSTFHRFFSQAKWDPDALWKVLAKLIDRWVPSQERIKVIVDDSVFEKSGRQIYGAGFFSASDPVGRKKRRVVWGQNWVLTAISIPIPCWPGRQIAMPVLARLYVKADQCKQEGLTFKTRNELALEMLDLLTQWLPERAFLLLADGGYGGQGLVTGLPERCEFLSRMRSDAALYELAPRRQRGQRGRPRKKGPKLPRLNRIASHPKRPWHRVDVNVRGKKRRCEVKEFVALWYRTSRAKRLKIFIVRYEEKTRSGKVQTREGYLYTTDLNMSAREAIEWYGLRWGIEVMIRDAKQMGVGEAPVRAKRSVERVIPFGLLTMATIIHWHLSSGQGLDAVRKRPWWREDRAPSFSDMRAALRDAILSDVIFGGSAQTTDPKEILRDLCTALANAA